MFMAILLYEKGFFFSKALKCLPAVIPRASTGCIIQANSKVIKSSRFYKATATMPTFGSATLMSK